MVQRSFEATIKPMKNIFLILILIGILYLFSAPNLSAQSDTLRPLPVDTSALRPNNEPPEKENQMIDSEEDLFKKGEAPMTIYEESEKEINAKLVGIARNYIGVSGSVALPEGRYASSRFDDNAGFAATGFSVNIEGAWLLLRNAGLGFSLLYNQNAIDKGAYIAGVQERLGGKAVGSITHKSWQNYAFLLGPTVSLPEDYLSFDLRVLFGVLATQAPTVTYNGSINGQLLTDTKEGATGIGFAYNIGASLSYPLPGRKYRVFMKADYLGSHPEIAFTHTTQSKFFNSSNQIKYNQAVSNFIIGLGLRHEFGYAKGFSDNRGLFYW